MVLAVTAVGTLVGGFLGKSRQEKEQIEGRIANTPTYFNTGIIGGLVASDTLIHAYNAVKKSSESLVGTTGKIGWVSLALPAALATAGSIWRKNSLQRDFDKAVAIRDANHAKTRQLIEAAVASTQAPTAPAADEVSFKNSVTPEEAAALLEKQAQAPTPTIEKPAPTPQIEKPAHTAHADKHEPAASHTEHAMKPEADTAMAMGA